MPDAFDVLGLRVAFDLPLAEIEAAYLARAAGLHPDLAGGDEEAPRRMAALNEARRTLANPETRAAALLSRLGGKAAEADKSLPPGFLMEMMERREAMEAELAAADAGARAEAEAAWDAWGRSARREAADAVAELFAQAQAMPEGAARAALLGQVRTRLNAWRYVERLLEQVRGAGPL